MRTSALRFGGSLGRTKTRKDTNAARIDISFEAKRVVPCDCLDRRRRFGRLFAPGLGRKRPNSRT